MGPFMLISLMLHHVFEVHSCQSMNQYFIPGLG